MEKTKPRSKDDLCGPCYHCGHVWLSRTAERKPVRCAGCKKARWDVDERGELGLPTKKEIDDAVDVSDQ